MAGNYQRTANSFVQLTRSHKPATDTLRPPPPPPPPPPLLLLLLLLLMMMLTTITGSNYFH